MGTSARPIRHCRGKKSRTQLRNRQYETRELRQSVQGHRTASRMISNTCELPQKLHESVQLRTEAWRYFLMSLDTEWH
jgi:hypothetical protein